MDGLKIVNIGAGSLYTPDFGEELARIKEVFPVREWVLEDIDPERLDAVGKMTEFLMKKINFPIKVLYSSNIKEAVKDADFIFTSFRVGGAESRILDEKVSEKNGVLGQETSAPGGLAMGLRNVPIIVEVARAVVEYAKPDAWLINLANPAGMLTEAVYRYTKCKAVGLCNWPTNFYKYTAAAYGVKKKDVFLRFAGVNHMNWAAPYVNGRHMGMEAYEKFICEFANVFGLQGQAGIEKGRGMFPGREILDFVGWPYVPTYMRLYYETEEMNKSEIFKSHMWNMMKDQLADKIPDSVLDQIDMSKAETRGDFTAELDRVAIKLYKETNEAGRVIIHSTRGGGSYAECGIEVANAIYNNTNEVLVVDHPNWGTVKGIEYEDVVETPCVVNRSGIWPIAMGEISTHMIFFIQEAKHYEKLAVKAAMEGNYSAALEALVISPLLHSFNKSRSVLDDLLVAHKQHLPNFAKTIARIESGQRAY